MYNYIFKVLLTIFLLFQFNYSFASTSDFNIWLSNFKVLAEKKGISKTGILKIQLKKIRIRLTGQKQAWIKNLRQKN